MGAVGATISFILFVGSIGTILSLPVSLRAPFLYVVPIFLFLMFTYMVQD
jgi:hypothetical protein